MWDWLTGFHMVRVRIASWCRLGAAGLAACSWSRGEAERLLERQERDQREFERHLRRGW
jgi:hypothetical protein